MVAAKVIAQSLGTLDIGNLAETSKVSELLYTISNSVKSAYAATLIAGSSQGSTIWKLIVAMLAVSIVEDSEDGVITILYSPISDASLV